jgi:hypothetical protein
LISNNDESIIPTNSKKRKITDPILNPIKQKKLENVSELEKSSPSVEKKNGVKRKAQPSKIVQSLKKKKTASEEDFDESIKNIQPISKPWGGHKRMRKMKKVN